MIPDGNLSFKCRSAGRVTAGLLLSFLALHTPVSARQDNGAQIHLGGEELPAIPPSFPGQAGDEPQGGAERFSLRHLFHHGGSRYPTLHRRQDVLNPEAQLYTTSEDGRPQELPPLMIRSAPLKMQRLADRRPSVIDPMIAAAREHGEVVSLSASAWTLDEIEGPDISDKATVVSMAEMAAAAYVLEPNLRGWENISHFHNSTDFGWEGDGLRGHIWANDKNSTIIISLKGTSMAVFDGQETTKDDKENDNLFFSCCCGQQGQLTWRKVCDCATSTYSCNNTCVVKNLRQENRYYQAARELYSNVTALYPTSNVWVSGHSLGGAVGSLLGMTYGLPTVTFESPPDNLAAKRLGLPLPPSMGGDELRRRGYTGTYHIGHTADPVFLGTCNGVTSLCSFAGYAMETACHSGQECAYDVVGDLGWRVSLSSHSIRSVIDTVLVKYDTGPKCVTTPECVDCPLWKFYESNSSVTTTTTKPKPTSTRTRTRTETCKTPGWWGCLDETTTATGTATSKTTSTATTTTCKTPGWFGCNDRTSTTTRATPSRTAVPTPTPTSPTTTSTISTTCTSPGYFGGCNDPTDPVTTSPPTSSTTCTSPGFFGGCNDSTEPVITSPPSTTCTSPGYFGGCNDPSPTGPPPTTTCATPGWWGCRDPTSPPPLTSPPSLPTAMPSPTGPTTTTKCHSYKWFGFVCADPKPTSPAAPTPKERCKKRTWFGFGKCKEWERITEL
ncbi:hypothetical protein VF21_05522 [Pseudogymnoascus sp. 05NY08]|nr:hypothetical protein VF21_05522 [Pseudogymnoascus sp. 05NY08]